MYKYGIAYYQSQGSTRVPVTGLAVKLVRPGANWASGLVMTETAPGYYEKTVYSEADCGFYEIWDDTIYPQGAHSGKHGILGKLDLAGLKDGDNILSQINSIMAQLAAQNLIIGADIYVQETEPQTPGDYVWIDTTGIDYIE